METVLKNNKKPGPFEQPRAWGIKKGTITGIDEVFTTLLKFARRNDNTPSLEDVKKQLSQLKP